MCEVCHLSLKKLALTLNKASVQPPCTLAYNCCPSSWQQEPFYLHATCSIYACMLDLNSPLQFDSIDAT